MAVLFPCNISVYNLSSVIVLFSGLNTGSTWSSTVEFTSFQTQSFIAEFFLLNLFQYFTTKTFAWGYTIRHMSFPFIIHCI